MTLARVRSLIVFLMILTIVGVVCNISLTELVARDRLSKYILYQRAIELSFGRSLQRRIRLASDTEHPGTSGTDRPTNNSDSSEEVQISDVYVGIKEDVSNLSGDNRTGTPSSESTDLEMEKNSEKDVTDQSKGNKSIGVNITGDSEMAESFLIRDDRTNISLQTNTIVTTTDGDLVLESTTNSNVTDLDQEYLDPVVKSGEVLGNATEMKKIAARALDPVSSGLRCQNLQKPIRILENGSSVILKPPAQDGWQVVLEQLVFVFSAHRDFRVADKIRVRVFGITLKVLLPDPVKSRFYCQLWTPKKIVLIVPARARAIGYKNRYESFVLDCDFPLERHQVKSSHFLSVTKFPCINPSNALRIHGRNESGRIGYRFSVCLLGSIQAKSYRRFIEWTELNVLLGAERIIVYVSDRSPAARRLLMYRGQVVLDSIAWTVPVYGAMDAIHTVLVNDCLYRSVARTQYLVLLAVNETLSPRATWLRSWDDMIREARCANSSQIIATIAYLDTERSQYDDNEAETMDGQPLGSGQLIQTAQEGIKGIVRPEHVDLISYDHIRFLDDVRTNPCIIPDNIGKLYHIN